MPVDLSRRFWVTLGITAVIVFTIGWVFIPATLSGNPAADGTVIKGFPYAVETFGGCAMGPTNTCQPFSYVNLVIDFVLLLGLTTAITAVLTSSNTVGQSLKQLAVYTGGWIATVYAVMTLVAILSIVVDALIPVFDTVIAVSVAYHAAYFYYGVHRPS